VSLEPAEARAAQEPQGRLELLVARVQVEHRVKQEPLAARVLQEPAEPLVAQVLQEPAEPLVAQVLVEVLVTDSIGKEFGTVDLPMESMT
jgi:hypothetical protein